MTTKQTRTPLCQEAEPDIFSAIRFGAILENVVFDEHTREVDFMSK
jgi:phosphoenolpyruvate carboxykinase (ATP)